MSSIGGEPVLISERRKFSWLSVLRGLVLHGLEIHRSGCMYTVPMYLPSCLCQMLYSFLSKKNNRVFLKIQARINMPESPGCSDRQNLSHDTPILAFQATLASLNNRQQRYEGIAEISDSRAYFGSY